MRTQPTGQNAGTDSGTVQVDASIVDSTPETPTTPEAVSQTSRETKLVKSLVLLPLLCRPSLDQTKAQAALTSSAVVVGDNSDHLYDSVDTLCSPKPAALKLCLQEGPHVYHVLEKPDSPKLTPPVPPKPQQRRISTASLPPSGSDPLNKKLTLMPKSVDEQLSSVLAIYEEVPATKKTAASSPSLLVPPRAPRPSTGGKKEEMVDHVYHVLENSAKNMPSQDTQRDGARLITEQTVKENNCSVVQICREENAVECAVCETEEVCFQYNMFPKRIISEPQGMTEDNKQAQQLSKKSAATAHGRNDYEEPILKNTPEENPKNEAATNEYAEPFTKKLLEDGHKKCMLFDDPAYCTHLFADENCRKLSASSQEASSNTGSQPQFDDPSYACPSGISEGRKGSVAELARVLFDDPKYNPAGIEMDSSRTTGSLKVKFDDPKYQSMLPSHVRGGSVRKSVRHSLSVEHFYTSSNAGLLASSEFMGKGSSSLHNLVDQTRGAYVVIETEL